MRDLKRYFLVFILAFFIAGCADTTSRSTGVYMLIDTSGTYTKEIEKAHVIIKYLLGTLQPGDAFAVARIDTGSFSEKDIIQKVRFDTRPSVANQQKRVFDTEINKFVEGVKGSRYTDITGGMLQAIEYLNEAGAGKKYILIFSDMQEELKKGYVRDIAFQLEGYKVIALNVTKLRTDIVDPRIYMDRLEDWRARVESGGGQWGVINDLEHLEGLLGR
ncbi:MAG: VWA domain-containing protein [Deltaproteobacteria bacterium]|nr:VWA domain-containing protein [Deltaproteobacteria bacterium]